MMYVLTFPASTHFAHNLEWWPWRVPAAVAEFLNVRMEEHPHIIITRFSNVPLSQTSTQRQTEKFGKTRAHLSTSQVHTVLLSKYYINSKFIHWHTIIRCTELEKRQYWALLQIIQIRLLLDYSFSFHCTSFK